MTRRGTTNTNMRGSAKDRRTRKAWLLATFGDGHVVMCAFGCGTELTFATLTVDRHPIPGADGGRYVRNNIRPACSPCNEADGARLARERLDNANRPV